MIDISDSVGLTLVFVILLLVLGSLPISARGCNADSAQAEVRRIAECGRVCNNNVLMIEPARCICDPQGN